MTMTKEQKDLLIQDLCGRLPYGVKCTSGVDDAILIVNGINPDCCGASEVQVTYERSGINFDSTISAIRPYLFPMSSITEEQEEELKNIYYSFDGMFQYTERIFDRIPFSKMKYFPYQIEEFFNKNHIDYRGLIPLGLANDATGLNIY